mmetsp:Transcript_27773/g.39228  ORF Transcript_27773/g.39228 Transcript_27773/m.39228 type:complete len:312 (-) Transcript_27773:349-1284(-)
MGEEVSKNGKEVGKSETLTEGVELATATGKLFSSAIGEGVGTGVGLGVVSVGLELGNADGLVEGFDEGELDGNDVGDGVASQTVPLPWNPSRHVQKKEPSVFVQRAEGSQLSVPSSHSFVSSQMTPFPLYPSLQKQSNDPGLLTQIASSALQIFSAAHSSTSSQTKPSPVYPAKQEHPKPGVKSLQKANSEQGQISAEHSLEVEVGKFDGDIDGVKEASTDGGNVCAQMPFKHAASPSQRSDAPAVVSGQANPIGMILSQYSIPSTITEASQQIVNRLSVSLNRSRAQTCVSVQEVLSPHLGSFSSTKSLT